MSPATNIGQQHILGQAWRAVVLVDRLGDQVGLVPQHRVEVLEQEPLHRHVYCDTEDQQDTREQQDIPAGEAPA